MKDKNIKKQLKSAGYAGIASLVLFIVWSILTIFMEYLSIILYDKEISTVLYAIITIILAVSVIYFFKGFVLIGKKLKNQFLVANSYIFIIFVVIYSAYLIIGGGIFPSCENLEKIENIPENSFETKYYCWEDDFNIELLPIEFWIKSVIMLILIWSFGIINIFFGIVIYKLKDEFGNIAKSAGILHIIAGILSMLIYYEIAVFLMLFSTILDIIILFRASEKFK